MKFASLTAPNGATVFVHPSMIVLPSLEHPGGSTLRTQMGTQEVREAPESVVQQIEDDE